MPRIRRLIPHFTTLRHWVQTQRSRRELARLPEHLLQDIGIDALARRHELSKPFWVD
ncbi:DUF1127 domain-containing protein [Allohahella marinimesophila]|uniref:DUF1127 domain-containing protein n=1 Tax=Allohahella marinimesophila TaxID=1054972 RepID=UPI0031DC05FB